ncbi:MAG: hypothetical protein J0M29_00625 [Chitinophagales bacterium]|nr:hypothetical protein [Chitinophagales bacterium]
MKSRKQQSVEDAELFEQAAKSIVSKAIESGWKKWQLHYKKVHANRIQVKRLAQAAELLDRLAHLAGTRITPQKKVVYSLFGKILKENRVKYLPHNWRRLCQKGDAILAGVSPGEVVKLPRVGNQNRRGKTNSDIKNGDT